MIRYGNGATAAIREMLTAHGLDRVEGAFAFGEGEDLIKAGLGHRRRTRLTLTDGQGHSHTLYLKRYEPEPPEYRRERFGSEAGSPAEQEFNNIQAVCEAGVPTMQAIVMGQEDRDCPRSFLLVSSVPGEKLENMISGFLEANQDSPEVIERFTVALAEFVRKFHAAGLVHRDLYGCHIFAQHLETDPTFHLIDLARVFRPRRLASRWRIKDLAQLYYSLPKRRWAKPYWPLFLRTYLPQAGFCKRAIWNGCITLKACTIQRHAKRKKRRAAGGQA